MISVRSRVHRTLRRMHEFEYASGDGKLIGSYSNIDGDPQLIHISEEGLSFTRNHEPEFLNFRDVVLVYGSQSKNSPESSIISLKLRNGDTSILDIRGKNGRFSDVYEWIRFLKNVVEDNLPHQSDEEQMTDT